MIRITICGGGSLGHACLGVLGSQPEVEVSLLTQHPAQWQNCVSVTDEKGNVYEGRISTVSVDPASVIPDADYVLLCLPGFLIRETMRQITPYLNPGTAVGSIVSSTGFFFFAHEELSEQTPLFGFQRTPYIARLKEYGVSANLLGYKSSVAIACEHFADVESFRSLVEELFRTKTILLESFYEAALTNSNPILHTGRLYTMWRQWDGTPYPNCSYFYKEWTEEDAQCLIDMDAEFMQLLSCLPMNKKSIPTLLDYYEQHDAASLAAKLRSIPAFQSILSPMKQLEQGGWVPDLESRYFREDFPFGLRFIVELARQNNLSVPTMEKVFEWGMNLIDKKSL